MNDGSNVRADANRDPRSTVACENPRVLAKSRVLAERYDLSQHASLRCEWWTVRWEVREEQSRRQIERSRRCAVGARSRGAIAADSGAKWAQIRPVPALRRYISDMSRIPVKYGTSYLAQFRFPWQQCGGRRGLENSRTGARGQLPGRWPDFDQRYLRQYLSNLPQTWAHELAGGAYLAYRSGVLGFAGRGSTAGTVGAYTI
jgi:hypothetical protein